MKKEYLGDGVYADFDGFQVILTAENGIHVTNTIYLEPQVMNALYRYFQNTFKRPEKEQEDATT